MSDACEPNLSVDVALDGEDTIVPAEGYASRVCADAGGTFNAETGGCGPSLVPFVCFRGGFCSEAGRLGLVVGSPYANARRETLGCNASQEAHEMWSVGNELALRASSVMEPGGPEWRSFALRLWLCR